MTYPPPDYGMQPPPTKRRKWPWIVAGIVVFGFLGCAGMAVAFVGGTAKVMSDVTGEMDANQRGDNAAVGEMNKPATDGKFAFTVTAMRCGLAKIGGEFGTTAQGEFCVVDVTIKNTSTTAELFADSSQKGVDADGNTYDVDSGASLSANEDGSTFFENINPGNSVDGKIAFDVPAGTELAAIVLHESAFTAGVKVPLG